MVPSGAAFAHQTCVHRPFTYSDSAVGHLQSESSVGIVESPCPEQSMVKRSDTVLVHWHCAGQSEMVHSSDWPLPVTSCCERTVLQANTKNVNIATEQESIILEIACII